MIKLSDRKPFAGGNKRDCYFLPDDASKIIKVIPRNKSPQVLHSRKVWLRRMLQSPEALNANRIESEKFEKLKKKLGDLPKVLPHLVSYFGKLNTDLAEGLVFQAIKNYDGRVSESINMASETGGYNKAALLKALKSFAANRHDAVIFNDIGKDNVVVQVLGPDHERYKFWIVDGINCAHFIPISEYSNVYATARKFKKLWQIKKFIKKNF